MAATTQKPSYLAGDRKVQPDGSIHLDAMWRNLAPAIAMLAGGACTIVAAVTQNLMWGMVGALALPIVVLANRRRQFVFDVTKRALLISDSTGGKPRQVGFDEIRSFDLAGDKGPWILTINGEPLCQVQRTYLNQNIKAELAAALGLSA